MTDDEGEPTVPIHCPECGTTTRVPLGDVASRIERHDAQRHGGADTARIDPAVADELATLVAEDLDLL